LLTVGVALALGAGAYRSMKTEGDHLTFDFSIWGDQTKRIFADVIDDTKQAAGRIAAVIILGPRNEVIDFQDIEFSEKGASPEARVDALERATSDPEGWSGCCFPMLNVN
jgi:hypothetical protein